MGNWHTHSDYSIRDAIQKVHKIMDFQIEHGKKWFSITDHGVFVSWNEAFELQDLYRKEGKDITFYPGVEFYLAPSEEMDQKFIIPKIAEYQKIIKKKTSTPKEKESARIAIENLRSIHSKPYYHITALAFNQTGLENLYRINNEGDFYYKHRVKFESLLKYNEGIIILTGCPAGVAIQSIMDGDCDRAEEYLKKLRDVYQDRAYAEIQWHDGVILNDTEEITYPDDIKRKYEEAVYKKFIAMARRLNIKLVGTFDSHYTYEADRKYWGITRKALMDKFEDNLGSYHMRADNSEFSVYTTDLDASLIRDIVKFPIEDAKITIDELDLSDSLIEARLTNEMHLPRSNYRTTHEDRCNLERLVWTGFKNKRIGTKFEEKSLMQIPYELSVIQTKGFDNYFLTVREIVDTAWQNGILVGPGRGSGAGSEAVYLIDITRTDPLLWELFFERFLNPGRDAMPDIDIDLESRVCNNFAPNDEYFAEMRNSLAKEEATDEEIREYWDRYNKLRVEHNDTRRSDVFSASNIAEFNKPIFDMPEDCM